MTNGRKFDQPGSYRIRLQGSFDENWLAYWFDGFVVTEQNAHETTLTGSVSDESALHGLLAKIRDLGLKLLLLERLGDQTKKQV